jgi:L-ascorbate metabolism protein UlaG (beta-lactamase superfamily)
MIILLILFAFIFCIFIFVNFAPQFGKENKGKDLERLKLSPNFRNRKFQNVETTIVTKHMDFRIIPKFFTSGNKVPSAPLPMHMIDPKQFLQSDQHTCRITWFGHSAVFLEMDGMKIFIDPMLGTTPSPHSRIGSKRFNKALPLSTDLIPDPDLVLLSHDHYDHLDYGTIMKLKNRVRKFIVPLGVGAHLISWGIERKKITELDWWDVAEFGGIRFTSTPSRHFSGRSLLDRDKTLWCSYVIHGKNDKIFFGADSGYDGNTYKKIGDTYGPFDLAMLECGQYGEHWPEIHMMPEEVVQASIDLNAKVLMPIHWAAFKLALHPWDEPIRRLKHKADEMNVRLTTPIIGESVIPGKFEPAERWWEI